MDQKASGSATEQEVAAFKAPADSALTDAQVKAYLQVALLQFDLVRREAPAWHQKVAEMNDRAKSGGTLAQFRNAVEGVGALGQMGDLIGGSYVRASRALHQNPAEMEWVRDRMNEVGGYLMAKPMLAAQVQAAEQMRAQASQMSGMGLTADQIAEMKKNADDMAANARGENQPKHVLANAELLHRVRPGVPEAQWTQVGLFGAASGLAVFAALGDSTDTESHRKLDEFRTLFQATLDGKPAPGMEDPRPAAPAAAPAPAAPAPTT
ncbi:MAG: hypothetical protein JWM27_3492 [Gemmatimonadetes bacterium]|nr:hypothetical protein [Gemmatimonadota bacterium]